MGKGQGIWVVLNCVAAETMILLALCACIKKNDNAGHELAAEHVPNTPQDPEDIRDVRTGQDLSPETESDGRMEDTTFEQDFRTNGHYEKLYDLQNKGSAHGLHQVWASSSARTTMFEATSNLDDAEYEVYFPAGSMFILESYHDAASPGLVMVMRKKSGGNEEKVRWSYEVRDTSGQWLLESGEIPGCIGCHEQFNSSEGIGSFNFMNSWE